jgi:UDP-glucose 4-epimerase
LEFDVNLGILRYFNVIGADPSFMSADLTPGALITRTFGQLMKNKEVTVFGGDLPTPDGTPLRDYVDVRDVATAHLSTLRLLGTKNRVVSPLVSSGTPTSALEIVNLVGKYLDKKPKLHFKPLSKTEPISISAKPDKDLLSLGWKPNFCLEKSVFDSIKALRQAM